MPNQIPQVTCHDNSPNLALSLILCSRNDDYMGNSRWRLETSLNYLAKKVDELGRERQLEVLVADWGSEIPLKDVVQLSPVAARIVSFLAIPPAVAQDLQKDSHFPEVLALNAAVRRASGQYLGRIDQDTLVGTRFLRTFFDLYENRLQLDVPLAKALMFANRRNIPYELAAASPPLQHVERLVDTCGGLLPYRTPAARPFWSYEVGIWLMHRNLWTEGHGYDERLIYFNWMEAEMVLRLNQKYPIVNLGEVVGYDFYHLGHYSRYAPRRSNHAKRKRNRAVDFNTPPVSLSVNSEEWGLAKLPLQPESAKARNGCAPTDTPGNPGVLSLSSWIALAILGASWHRLTFVFGLMTRSLNAIKRRAASLGPQARLAKQVRKRKETRARSGNKYTDLPRVSLVLLSFNHRDNVARIVERLRRTQAEELIVCEDGSIDGAREEWLKHLTRPNDFVICSNDIHEIRVHNRAVALAAGEIICFLQDDDIPPEDGEWVQRALRLFARYPRLAILGGHHGYALDLSRGLEKPKVRWVYGYRDSGDWKHVKDIPFVDPESGISFMFVEGVSVGPVFHRRSAFNELGGFDLSYAKPGEPGTLAEHSICLKAWLAGWEVGLFEPPQFEKYVGGQGTKLFSSDERRRNEAENLVRIRNAFAGRTGEVEKMVDGLNSSLVRRNTN